VFAVQSQTLPDDHPDLQAARQNLASTKKALGQLSDAARLNLAGVTGALERVCGGSVSVRDVSPLAIAAAEPLSHVGSLLDASVVASIEQKLDAEMASALTRDSVALLEAVRGAQLHTTRLLRAAEEHDPDFEEHRQVLGAARKALDDAISLPPEGRTNAAGEPIRRDDAIAKAVFDKDAAERALLASVPEELRTAPSAEALASGLASDEAAITFLTYTRWTNDPDEPWITTSENRFAAFVLTPSGDVTWHSLVAQTEVEGLVASIRELAFAGSRGVRPSGGPDLDEQRVALRRLLFDPLLDALPEGTNRLVVSLADELHLVPIEDLPLEDGGLLGTAMQIKVVPSLRELMYGRRGPDGSTPTALVVGSVDYDQAPDVQAPVFLDVATPILADAMDAATRSADADGPGENPAPKEFADLFNTEAKSVGNRFGRYVQSDAVVLTKVEASEAAFVAQAPGKAYLHLATHGYFAPESAWRATDARDENDALARFDIGQRDKVAQLSPFSLTGIALAGANLPADELGRREGILTAEEIAQLDLSSCYLATLSACNTSLGVRRGGTGLASLRQAFHAAGVRFVLATLWEVNDVYAEDLMADFYTRLWKHGEDPRSALRAAKQAARERGVPFRDWAGWMITGL
jgi:hypothetical protein